MEDQLELDVKACDGKNIGNRYKIVNNIIKKLHNNEYTISDIKKFVETWSYTDCPTMVLYLSVINFAKNSDVVIKFLTSENDLLIHRTIKICIFFWADRTYTLDFYIKTIFPYLSYSNRNYLFKTLAKNLNDEKLAEMHFEHIKQIYGIVVARPFLIYCSTDYILSLLKIKIVLTVKEMKLLAKRDAKFIFKFASTVCDFRKHQGKLPKLTSSLGMMAIMKWIIITDTAKALEIIELNKKWLYVESFGRRITKHVLRTNRSLVLADPKFYKSILTRSVLFKFLTSEEYKTFYKGLFPEKIISVPDLLSDSWSDWEDLFSYLEYYTNKNDKRKLLLDSYRSVYGEDLLDNPKNITPNILELLEVGQRVQFAREKIEKCDSSDIYKWTSYLTCEEAITALKREIYVTPDANRRLVYLEYMITSCYINDDMPSLLEVLKYFNMRHRNEEGYIRSGFIYFTQNKMDLDKLTLEHWEEISELIAVAIINHDIQSYYGLENMFIALLKYCLFNNLPMTKYLKQYLKWSYACGGCERYNLFKHNKNHEKKFLLLIGELIPDTFLKDDDNNSTTIVLLFLNSISSWNQRHPHDIISAVDFEYWTADLIKKVFESNDNYEKRNIVQYIKNDKKATAYFAEELKNLKYEIDVFDLKTAYVESPGLVMEQIKDVYKACSNSYFIKAHLMPLLRNKKINRIDELCENIKSFFLKVISCFISYAEGSENPSFKESRKLMPGAIRFLSHFISADEFYSAVKLFYPKNSRIDVDTASDMYDIQKSIAISIKNYANNSNTFEALRNFCAGDYLQLTIGSLNSICVKSSLRKVQQFLTSCIDVPVSFKKHVIRLLCLISDKYFVTELLQNLWKTETNPSIRHVLLKYAFNIFSEEPSENSWILIKNFVEALSDKDKNSMTTILNYEEVSDYYVSEYIHLTWTMLNKLDSPSVNLKSHKANLLNSVVDFLHLISDGVVQEILRGLLFYSDSFIMDNICHLAVHYILSGQNKDIQQSRMNLVLHEMKESFENYWNVCNEQLSYITRRSINYFIETLCSMSLHHEKYKEKPDFVLSSLITQLNLIFDPSLYIYSSYIMIRLSIALKINTNLKEFGADLRSLVDSEISSHGIYIIHILSKILNNFLSKNDKKALDVVDGLLTEPIESVGCAYLAVNIIKLEEIFMPKNQSILKRFTKINDRKINIMLNMYN